MSFRYLRYFDTYTIASGLAGDESRVAPKVVPGNKFWLIFHWFLWTTINSGWVRIHTWDDDIKIKAKKEKVPQTYARCNYLNKPHHK